MKKFTTVAVIAALALATQVFAMGGSMKGGTSMSRNTMKSGSQMTAGTATMKSGSQMRAGTGTMKAGSQMTSNDMAKPQMAPGRPMQPVVAK